MHWHPSVTAVDQERVKDAGGEEKKRGVKPWHFSFIHSFIHRNRSRGLTGRAVLVLPVVFGRRLDD